jgi:putative hydrolase of the HAD superfamily
MALGGFLFDLDDTLIVEESFAKASLRESVKAISGNRPDDEVETVVLDSVRALWCGGPSYPICIELGIAPWEGLWATFEGGHPILDALRDWAPSFRREAWSAVAAALWQNDPDIEAEMEHSFLNRQRSGHPSISGARQVVEALASEYPVGLVTNGPPDVQRLKLEQAELTGLFESIVISGELGHGKPDPRVFASALHELECDAAEVMMVGDSWERDVLGALRAGSKAAWVAAGRTPPCTHPDVSVIQSVAELDTVLEASGR